jgi:hypothetical protein
MDHCHHRPILVQDLHADGAAMLPQGRVEQAQDLVLGAEQKEQYSVATAMASVRMRQANERAGICR